MILSFILIVGKISYNIYMQYQTGACIDKDDFKSYSNFDFPAICLFPKLTFAMEFHYYFLQVIDSLKEEDTLEKTKAQAIKLGVRATSFISLFYLVLWGLICLITMYFDQVDYIKLEYMVVFG